MTEDANQILPLLELKNASAIAVDLYGIRDIEKVDRFLQSVISLKYSNHEYSPESIHFACMFLANKYMLRSRKKKAEVVSLCPEAGSYIDNVPVIFTAGKTAPESAGQVINCMNLYASILVYFDGQSETQACEKTAEMINSFGKSRPDGTTFLNMSQNALVIEIGGAIRREISTIVAGRKATYGDIISYFPEAEKYI